MNGRPLSLETPVLLIRQMSHDLRGLLSVMTNTTDLMTQGVYGELTPKQARATERLRRTSARMLTLVDDLATYVKAEAQQYPLTIAPFEPRALLAQIAAETRPVAESKGLTLALDIDAAIPASLFGDQAALGRVILALVWNAISFTGKGQVRLMAGWSDQGEWIVDVHDSGPGLPAESVPHVFAPFWQGPAGSPVPTSGCGLGLAQAGALVRLMGGELCLHQTGAAGSVFRLRLKLTPAQAGPGEESGAGAAQLVPPGDPQHAPLGSEQ